MRKSLLSVCLLAAACGKGSGEVRKERPPPLPIFHHPNLPAEAGSAE